MLLVLFEVIFSLFVVKEGNLLVIILTSLAISAFFSLVLSFFSKNIQNKLNYIFIIILLIIFLVHTIYYTIFDDILSLNTILNNLKAIAFYEVLIDRIIRYWYLILIYIILAIINILLIHKNVMNLKKNKNYYIAMILFILSGILVFNINKNTDNILIKSARNNGLLMTICKDIKNTFFNNDSKIIYNENNEKYLVSEYNILNTEFPKTKNEEINEISSYLKNSIPSNKNEYTGIFKDKNLIIILAESFSDIAIDKELTPTLYKLYNDSIRFNNYYAPTFRIGTADAEYMLDNSLYPVDIETALVESNNNHLIYNYANVFKDIGYKTYAYHNYDYDFYERDKYFENLKYNYLACGNGLEEKINCSLKTPSDYEMMKNTVNDYINDEKFMTYYVTMSGHFNYSSNHTIVEKNYNLVKELPYSEKVKYYLATQIELDKGIEALMKELKDNNKLDNTVIMLVGDHYPHGLTLDEFNEKSSYKRDKMFEKVKMPLIIYNPEVKNISTDKYFSMIDILPTILNLYGISFDSRLLIGRDVFSENETPVIFYNRSFITNKGTYNALLEKGEGTLTKDDIKTVKDDMYNKFRASRLILENDYYSLIK